MIPSSFVELCWIEITNPVVVLRLPNGVVWDLTWIQRNAVIWLTNKWVEFAQFYSLKNGHFLFFRNEGNSHFRVVICDLSASKIQCPSFNQRVETLEDHNIRFSSLKKSKSNPKERRQCVATENHQSQRIKFPQSTKSIKGGLFSFGLLKDFEEVKLIQLTLKMYAYYKILYNPNRRAS